MATFVLVFNEDAVKDKYNDKSWNYMLLKGISERNVMEGTRENISGVLWCHMI